MTVSSSTHATTAARMFELYSVEFDNYEESEKLTAFLDTVKEKLDDVIGQELFRPNFKAIFKGIEIEDWKEEEDGVYCLTLSSAYKAARDDEEGKTFIFEKEIRIKFDPDNARMTFPKVVEFKENGGSITEEVIKKKGLNAIWAQEHHLFSLYTGVGYQTTWDPKEQQFVSDNINDAGWALQWKATPRRKSMKESLQEWGERGREKID